MSDPRPGESAAADGGDAPLIAPEELAGWVLREDGDLLVINKPGGIVCHPSKNGPWSSLVGACRERFGLETVHLVHRLDRETSGLVVLAKNRRTARLTQMAFQNRQVEKTYLAILEGTLVEPVTVKNQLARDMESPVYIKQTVRKSNSSQKAETAFTPLATGGGYTLARVVPVTGRKHQIRVHAKWLGHAIAGDKIYGPDDALYLEFIETGWTPRLAERLPLPRQALHAETLRFNLPDFPLTLHAPLPEDLRAFLHGKIDTSSF